MSFDELMKLLNTNEDDIKVLNRSSLAPLKDKEFAKV
jgi:hypothetical protein